MQEPSNWVSGLSAKQRKWVLGYLGKRVHDFPELNQAWEQIYPPVSRLMDSDSQEVEKVTELVRILQSIPGGSEQFRRMDDSVRKQEQRRKSKTVERILILDRESDQTLRRMMRYANKDRSSVIRGLIHVAADSRKPEWDDIQAERSRLAEKEKRLRETKEKQDERERRFHEARKKLREEIRRVRGQRDRASRELQKAQEERDTAWEGLYSLVWALSMAPDDAAVEFQFDEKKQISGIDYREGSSRVKVWSKPVRRKLRKALEPFMSKKTESADQDNADQSENSD